MDQMTENKRPELIAAIFCNSASSGESGKIDCRGIFTSFLAWGYPTGLRSWHAVLTLFNLPQGKTSIKVSIAKIKGRKTDLAKAEIDKGKRDIGNVVNFPLRYKFKNEGFYYIYFTIEGTNNYLKVPIKVTTEPWPEFTKEHIDFLLKNPSIPNSIRINVYCSECSHPYTFEENVLPDVKLAGGVHPFPQNGIFKCESCGQILHLKDIQGQVRDSIKKALSAAMQKKN